MRKKYLIAALAAATVCTVPALAADPTTSASFWNEIWETFSRIIFIVD